MTQSQGHIRRGTVCPERSHPRDPASVRCSKQFRWWQAAYLVPVLLICSATLGSTALVVPRPLPAEAIDGIVRVCVGLSDAQASLLEDVILPRYASQAAGILADADRRARAWEARWGQTISDAWRRGDVTAVSTPEVRAAARLHAGIRLDALMRFRRIQTGAIAEFAVFLAPEQRDALDVAAMQVDREQLASAIVTEAGRPMAGLGVLFAAVAHESPHLSHRISMEREAIIGLLDRTGRTSRAACDRATQALRTAFWQELVKSAAQQSWCGVRYDEARCRDAMAERLRARQSWLDPLHDMLGEEERALRAFLSGCGEDLADAIGRAWARTHMGSMEAAGFFEERAERRAWALARQLVPPDDSENGVAARLLDELIDVLEERMRVRETAIADRRAWCLRVERTGSNNPEELERHRGRLMAHHEQLVSLGNRAATLLEEPAILERMSAEDRQRVPALNGSLRSMPAVPDRWGYTLWPGLLCW